MTFDLNTDKGRKAAYRDLMWRDHGFLRSVFNNLHEIGGGMYRANQPSPKQLARYKAMGIKTILNLRGVSNTGYYALEKEACEELGLKLIDFRMYSRDTHRKAKLVAASELFDKIEYPCVMHCKSGADRTGIMGVLYRHFKMGDDIEDAQEQLSLKYLHMEAGKTGMLDHFFKAYLDYNAHSPISFIDWVKGPYDRMVVKKSFMSKWWGSALTEGILRRE